MTTPNKITIGRTLLVPFFILQLIYYARTGSEWHRIGAVVIFALASLGDGLDGYIARRYHQHSELGAILDPVGDKLLLFSGVILLSLENNRHFVRIPVWLTVTILSRDIILLIGLGVIYYTFGKIEVRPRMSSKAATVLQMAVVLWTLLQWPAGALPWLAVAAGLVTASSGLLYLLDGVRRLNSHPASAAAPRQP
jgi:CDP-diacylglycerol--glycerol-3-phosphate 3-phosphatidyltransferase